MQKSGCLLRDLRMSVVDNQSQVMQRSQSVPNGSDYGTCKDQKIIEHTKRNSLSLQQGVEEGEMKGVRL